MPLENIAYFSDTTRVPYGVKRTDTIHGFTGQIIDHLLGRGVKLLIFACNTMAAVARDVVDERAKARGITVLDVIDSGAREAARVSASGHIGVIGTPTTINSNACARRIHAIAPHARVFSQACPLFVPLVEEGWLDHLVTRMTAQEYLKPVLAEQIDALVLGCTHYPLLKPLLKDVIGPGVHLIDSAVTVAEQTAQVLRGANLAHTGVGAASIPYCVSDVPLRFQSVGERFLGRTLERWRRWGLFD